MVEIAYSVNASPKPPMQFSLQVMVKTIPEAIAYLRGGLYRLPKAVPEGASETKNANGPGPQAPADLNVIDAADKQLEILAYWAEVCGVDMTDIGRTWRYHPSHPELAGYIRGIANDDPRPADRLSVRLLMAMRSRDWVEPAGMHASLHGLLATHSKTWPAVHDLLLGAR
ncbi:hypothetical protein AB0O58_12005 [Rhodococcus sp. NPDC080181]|uniref:hypothetical protein n=1 Tax=Rhodococcus sp. NPDC080181 TaxID=3155292 RepID=UPI00344CFA6A